MSDAGAEVERLLEEVKEKSAPKPKKRGRPPIAPPPEEVGDDEPFAPSPEDADLGPTSEEVEAAARAARLPEPVDKVKTIESLMSKYNIGSDPRFKVQVHRNFPTVSPGGAKCDGYMDTYSVALSNDMLASEYGGGTYLVRVVGPDPKRPGNATKPYESIMVQIAGTTKWSREPMAIRANQETTPEPAVQTTYTMGAPEHPKLAETAMKVVSDAAASEREERRRLEAKLDDRAGDRERVHDQVIDAERRRADDLLRSERERAEAHNKVMDERLDEERRTSQELRERMDNLERSRPSMADELGKLKEAGIFGRDDSGLAKDMVTQILERHHRDLEAVHGKHAAFVDQLRGGHERELVSMREAHAREIESMREAYRREMESEREAGRGREQRIEERLGSEREERRRDQDRFTKAQEDRDVIWRDRLEQQKITMDAAFESRLTAQKSSHENRQEWQQGEIDRLRSELADERSKRGESTDLISQAHKLGEVRNVLKEMGLVPDATSSVGGSGGIGLSGSVDWKDTLAENTGPLVEKVIDKFFSEKPSSQPQQPQYQPGQVVPTEKGLMVVVIDPATNQLKMTPKVEYDRYLQHLERGKQPSLLGGAKPAAMGPGGRSRRAVRSRKPKVSAVPNLAYDENGNRVIDAPKPPWEGGTAPQQRERAPEPPPEPPRREEVARPSSEPLELNNQERMVLNALAKQVHESVMVAAEPEEFVGSLLGRYPKEVLGQVVGSYSPDQVARGIAQVQPGGAGATPAGQAFIREAFGLLREQLSD